MLKTVDLTTKRYENKHTVMLLGGFDGLHIGHRTLLTCAQKYGLPVGVMSIVGGKDEKSLFTFAEREDVFLRAGADFVFELPFCKIKNLSPESFISLLEKEFFPKVFVCGEDFRFGSGASGNVETLKSMGHVCVEVCPQVKIDEKKISSTMVKEYLSKGDVCMAKTLLGEEFFLLGEVFRDRGVGKTLGFPTANVRYAKEKFPLKIGVYETRVIVDGKTYTGITNYGARPTFDNTDVLTETYLDGFSGDLYGKTIKISFVRFMREVQKFEGKDKLIEQLQSDIRSVRKA